MDGQADTFLLGAVAQSGVENLKIIGHRQVHESYLSKVN
jgi:hypothetical protein